jgi:glycerophosphoryl diester phosphodiesterase
MIVPSVPVPSGGPATTRIVAHRGRAGSHPDNTLPAFEAAAALGADAVELDVHFSADSQLVVHHDHYLRDADCREVPLFQLDSGFIRGRRVGGSGRIPLLADVFDRIGTRVLYEVELKGFTAEFLDAVIALIRASGLDRHVEITSSNRFLLARLSALAPEFATGTYVDPFPAWMEPTLGRARAVHTALLGGVDVLHCPLDIVDAEFISLAHRHGLGMHAVNCSTEPDLRAALALGVDQLSTDDLALALAVRRAHANGIDG